VDIVKESTVLCLYRRLAAEAFCFPVVHLYVRVCVTVIILKSVNTLSYRQTAYGNFTPKVTPACSWDEEELIRF